MNKDLLPNFDDLPQDRASCANCTRTGGSCARRKNGYIMGYNGEIAGYIACCVHYTGLFKFNN